MKILRNFFDSTGMPTPVGRKCPTWLGTFNFHIFGIGWGKQYESLPTQLQALHNQIVAAAGFTCDFTTWFLQRYPQGSQVHKHRDPRNNLYWTYIAVYGDFDGATTTVWSPTAQEFKLNSGDVGILPCTQNGVQGPYHQVSPITRGTRYAFIGNNIK